jgi:hypothetical protein
VRELFGDRVESLESSRRKYVERAATRARPYLELVPRRLEQAVEPRGPHRITRLRPDDDRLSPSPRPDARRPNRVAC